MMRGGFEQGYLQVYTGNGKGKTTAALGLALRASGRAIPVYIGQFMKGQDYGELAAVKQLSNIHLAQYGDPGWVRKGELKAEQIAAAERGLQQAHKALCGGDYKIVILDEFNMALWFELITLPAALELIDARPLGVELVVTGRNAHAEVLARADLITEMREVRHYYANGVGARLGIEN